MGWSYGLVERKIPIEEDDFYSELTICEVYFDKKGELSFYAPLDWEDIKEADKMMILDDLKGQMNNNSYWFKEEDFNL